MGYTVIDPTSVLVTHLSEVLQRLAELLSRDDVKELVENAKSIAPAVVEEASSSTGSPTARSSRSSATSSRRG